MSRVSYEATNESKKDFGAIYQAPTPHAYLREMSRLGYQIGEQARPYCDAVASLMRELNGDAYPLTMLDVGCSYGLASAFVRYGCTFEEIVSFFDSRAPRDRVACAEAMRHWLNVVSPAHEMRVVGLDVSSPAVEFGLQSGLLDAGITKNLEVQGTVLDDQECDWIRSCGVLVSTGAIGYVSERTLGPVIHQLGRNCTGTFGPAAVFTVLRMFDIGPITRLFELVGWRCASVPDVLLQQRKFASPREQAEILARLEERGIATDGCESEGILVAQLFVASPSNTFDALMERMREVHRGTDEPGTLFSAHVEVATTDPHVPVETARETGS